MIPINLGGYATQIGRGGQFRTPATPPQRSPAQPAQATPDIQREARAYGLAEALSEPIEIGSGSWAEALAEGLAGGLRGRAASRMYAAELERNQAQSQREQQSQGIQDDLRRAQIEALQAEARQAGIPDWSPVPREEMLPGARYGERNRRTGETRWEWTPQGRSTPNATPDLPPGFVLD